jgi:16S rRNA (adenine1518-N6/adenine1519-N6)-dimethyltransferase
MTDLPVNAELLKRRREAVEGLLPLREVIAAYELRAQKSLGQNFLLDINITDKIVREAMARDGGSWAGVHAFEVGSGPGGLTRALLKSDAQKVTAIEFDSRAIGALSSLVEAGDGCLTIIEGDALKTDILSLGAAPRVIVANLPYNIATPLLIGWLRDIRKDSGAYGSMSLMFQREVAERIFAAPNTKHYGRLAVITQWLCYAERLYDLPPSAFTPPPKVNSTVVYFRPRVIAEDAPSFEAVERLSASAFNQRRKMIRSSLKTYMPALEALGIDTQKRAENLSVDEFLSIAKFSQE